MKPKLIGLLLILTLVGAAILAADAASNRPHVAIYYDNTAPAKAALSATVDSDNDGVPDAIEARPFDAGYYKNDAPAKINWLEQAENADSDKDGLPDRVDVRPADATYYDNTAPASLALTTTADSDNDGIPDASEPRPFDANYYKNNAPAKEDPLAMAENVDSDNDGLPDKYDNRPHDATYYQAAPAKPKVEEPVQKPAEQPAIVDSDGDGVPDNLDKCPNTPKGVKVDANGCPLDSDGDGVPDYLDKCPDTPKGVAVDANGCPLDSDGDGVPDYLDKCPNTPKGVPVDANGCPVLIKKGEKITLQIEFPTNSYEIDAKSKEILDGIAKTMVDFPDIKVAISGYTDDRGAEAHNMTLSKNRAKAVLSYLESKGVPAKRMSSTGHGEDPKYFIGDNKTEEGRQKNRRVEILSVD